MPQIVDLYYHQSTQNKTQADQYHHCTLQFLSAESSQSYTWTTKTYESPRLTSFSF